MALGAFVTLSQQGFSEERRSLSPGLDVLDVRLDASSMQDRRMASAQPRHLDTSSTLTPVTPPVVNVKDPRHLDA